MLSGHFADDILLIKVFQNFSQAINLQNACNSGIWSQMRIITGLKKIQPLLWHFHGFSSWVLVAHKEYSLAPCNRDYLRCHLCHLLLAETLSVTLLTSFPKPAVFQFHLFPLLYISLKSVWRFQWLQNLQYKSMKCIWNISQYTFKICAVPHIFPDCPSNFFDKHYTIHT